MPDCVAEDHEVRSATLAEELEGIQRRESFATTSRCGEGTEHHHCHRTPRISSLSSTLIMNRLLRSNRQRERQVRRVSCEAEGSVQEASNTAWCFGREEQQKRVQSISEYQTEVEIELDVEDEKAAEIKNQVQTAKNSLEAQQHRAATASKEVAVRCNRSGETVSKFKLQRTQELTRTQHEDGKQDAWNGHAQVASQAMAVPEEYGPDKHGSGAGVTIERLRVGNRAGCELAVQSEHL